jgi:nicotinamide-nucleotide amidase
MTDLSLSNNHSADTKLKHLTSKLADVLIEQKLKVVTVESCTGGQIGKALTDKAGSSAWFAGGLITYTNESKHQLAQVPMEHFDKYGAVSTQVVEAMAQGALNWFDGCISVAVSGIAGPTGGSDLKPVGTVCIAVCLKGKTISQQFLFDGNRKAIRKKTVKQALVILLNALS